MDVKSFPKIVRSLCKTQFVRDVFTLQIGGFGAQGIGFLKSVVFARMLGLELFGIYAVALAIRGTFAIFVNLGQGQATATFFAESYGKNDTKGMEGVLRYNLLLSSFSIVLLLIFAAIAPEVGELFYDDRSVGVIASVAFIAIAASAYHNVFIIMLQTLRRIKLMTILENINLLLQLVFAVLFLALGYGPVGIFLGLLTSNLLMQVVYLWTYYKIQPGITIPHLRSVIWTKSPIKEYFIQGLWIALHKNLNNYLLPSTLFIMSLYATPEHVGIAQLAFNIGALPATLMLHKALQMTSTVLPSIASSGVKTLRSTTAKLVKHAMAFHAALSLAGLVGLPLVVIVLYGWEYSAVIPVMIWIVLINILQGALVANATLFRLCRKSHIPALWLLVMLGVQITTFTIAVQWLPPLDSFVVVILMYNIGQLMLSGYLFDQVFRKKRYSIA